MKITFALLTVLPLLAMADMQLRSGHNHNMVKRKHSIPEHSPHGVQGPSSKPREACKKPKKRTVTTPALVIGNVEMGFLPDDTSQGGPYESLVAIEQAIGYYAQTYGRFSQVVGGVPYTGSQLSAVFNDIVASKATLEAAVMPIGSYQGLTKSNNSQAINICNVMNNFTKAGVPVRMRFAPESNYYLNDGQYNGKGVNTYPGSAADLIQAHQVVYTTCKSINKKIQIAWSPSVEQNVANLAPYYPGNAYVDAVGLDYYAQNASSISSSKNPGAYYKVLKPFSDIYASSTRPLYQFETGCQFNTTEVQKLQWLNQVIQARKSGLPLKAVTWFNYARTASYNGSPLDFRIVDPNNKTINTEFVNYVKKGQIA